MHPSVEHVVAILRQHGATGEVRVLEESARTAAQAASALGVGEVRRADPDTVRRATGQVIGGVAPVGHPAQVAG